MLKSIRLDGEHLSLLSYLAGQSFVRLDILKTGLCYVAQADLKVMLFLPQPPGLHAVPASAGIRGMLPQAWLWCLSFQKLKV